jgi:hypothetical protein
MAYAMHLLKLSEGQENCGTPDASLQWLGGSQRLSPTHYYRLETLKAVSMFKDHETGIFKPDMKMLKVHQNAPTSMLKSQNFS